MAEGKTILDYIRESDLPDHVKDTLHAIVEFVMEASGKLDALDRIEFPDEPH